MVGGLVTGADVCSGETAAGMVTGTAVTGTSVTAIGVNLPISRIPACEVNFGVPIALAVLIIRMANEAPPILVMTPWLSLTC